MTVLVPVAPGLLIEPSSARRSLKATRRITYIAIAILVFGIGGAATLIPIGGAVITNGQVSMESFAKRVSHPTGGVIAEIDVKTGDHVHKGQLLMRLASNVMGANARYSAMSVDQLLAQQARLDAEHLGASSVSFPEALSTIASPDVRKAMTDEGQLFALRKSEASGLQAQLADRISQYREEIAGHEAQIAALARQLKLIQPERDGLSALWQKRLVTISRVNQLERNAADLEGNIGSLRANIGESRARIAETRQQSIQLTATRRIDAGTQLAGVNTALAERQTQRIGAQDAYDRSAITAPATGTVGKLAYTTVGDVVRPAETVMEIIPTGDQPMIDASVLPPDIDKVHVGQRVRIRFTTLGGGITPEISGKVVVVSPEKSMSPQGDSSYYEIRVRPHLDRKTNIPMLQGMPVELMVETKQRSMIYFLTKPLMDQISRSFRAT